MPEKPLIKLEYQKLTEQERIDLGTLVAANMALAANAAIVTGSPLSATQVLSLTTGYSTGRQLQITTKQAAKTATTNKNTLDGALGGGLTQVAKFLESKTNASEAMFEAIGFAIRSPGAPPPVVPPEGLALTFGDGSGEVDAHWNPLRGAIAYIVQQRLANTPGAAWAVGYQGSKSSCTVSGLTPGALYEFQVCAMFAGVTAPGPNCPVVEQRAS